VVFVSVQVTTEEQRSSFVSAVSAAEDSFCARSCSYVLFVSVQVTTEAQCSSFVSALSAAVDWFCA